MASEDVKTSESAVSTIVNLAEEAKLAREGVKALGPALLSICKSLVAGGVAGGVWVLFFFFGSFLLIIVLNNQPLFILFVEMIVIFINF